MRYRYIDAEAAGSVTGGVVVVVDVMRAFTVAAWALHRGADRITLVDDVDRAIEIGQAEGALLFKDGRPDPRFDLHNSPRQLLDLDVEGRSIVQRTTAGTRSAVAAKHADVLLCASLVCASATAAHIASLDVDEVTFLISGGLNAEEDLSCAELISELLDDPSTDPGPYVRRAADSAAAADLMAGVRRGYAGVTSEDVPMCLDVDRFSFHLSATTDRTYPQLRRTVPG